MWTLSGDDAGDFNINSSTGALTFKAVPDFEAPADTGPNNVYNVTVNVRDNRINTPGNTNGNIDSAIDHSISITVTVTNVNEAPVITTKGPAFTALSTPEGTLTTVELAVYKADDPEIVGDSLTWTLTGPDADRFRIPSNATERAFSGSTPSPTMRWPRTSA